MKNFWIITLFILPFLGKSQSVENSFDQLEKGRPIAILFTTEWCSVCRTQKKILEKMPHGENRKVDFISINPEKYVKDIDFLGKKYRYVSNGTSGLHRIVYDLAGGRVPAYPFWVFVDENQRVKTYEGLLKEKELSLIFSYQ